ncbi:uncharacterized protein TRIADDRAFT_58806 [Trichoplax adhaerens]|uniref:Thioredoxin domain-containing protein n=1 Tax=Trichoplax adhaerens TaxID=10228 RepID=B3S3Q4_TRIAD|nr:hypothetical protein TRIADDRAFT_58806 [Trichoplax adhaerens]EDV22509.1 hypothetical protein TRIADDRAFT_58806 [Trichoplax adhaerens]|eukprot:XP_002115053.1 hypothetical protein TRIADDRAFT_58806 [Trichoplax adhaerens]
MASSIFMIIGLIAFSFQLAYTVELPKISISELKTHVLNVRTTTPTCAVYIRKQQGVTKSALSAKFAEFWKKISLEMPYARWNYGIVELDHLEVSDISMMPSTIPSLACHIGLMIPNVYNNTKYQYAKNHFHQYLMNMSKAFKRSLKANTIGNTDKIFSKKGVTLLAFTGLHEPKIVDNVLFQAQARWKDSLHFYIVNHLNEDGSKLITQFGIHTFPTLLFLNNSDRARFYIMKGFLEWINLFMTAYKSKLIVLNEGNFKKEVLTPTRTYKPFVVCFYAHWGQNIIKMIASLSQSHKIYSTFGSNVRFGMVNIYDNRNVVMKFPPAATQILPFTMLFWQTFDNKEAKIRHEVLVDTMPTPYALYDFAKRVDVTFHDGVGDSVTPCHFRLATRLRSVNCSVLALKDFGSVNRSVIVPCKATIKILDRKRRELHLAENLITAHNSAKMLERKKSNFTTKAKILKLTMEKYAKSTDMPTLQFKTVGRIPIITDNLWQEVIERSKLPTNFYPGISRSNDQHNVAISLVIFTKNDCKSCKKKSQTFQDIAKLVQHMDHASIYIINCDHDPLSCQRHGVSGFPSLSAFRSFGWFRAEECLSKAATDSPYIRLDYHGPIETKYVMDWFSKSTISNTMPWKSRMDKVKLSAMSKDVRLVATVYPQNRAKSFLYSQKKTWYPLKCFQLACERIYGQVDCYYKRSNKIAWLDSDGQNPMAISEINMERKDQVTANIITHGRSIAETIEDESKNAIHRFHAPHRYKISPKIRCEDNYPQCTDHIVSFVIDHMRLPITHITLESFHIRRVIGSKGAGYHAAFAPDEPILVAIVNEVDSQESSTFYKELLKAAYALYQKVAITLLNVEEFPTWASQFVPIGYHKEQIKKYRIYGDDFKPLLYRYPRLCILYWNNHRRAAFYPPLSMEKEIEVEDKEYPLTAEKIMFWVDQFKRNPDTHWVTTERF